MSAVRWDAARWDAAWCAEAGGPGTLVLTAGADRRVAVDGLHPGTVEWALGLPAGREAAVRADTDEQRALLDRLVELGAIAPVVGAATVSLVHDDAAHAAALDLANRLRAHGIEVAGSVAPSVVLRTGDEWPVPPDHPHLGVDLTLHHTVLVGPFVLPGASACLRCLQARTDHQWPRSPVAPSPRVQRFLGTVADLVAIQLELAAAGRSPLVNATIAWDLERGVSDRQRIFKLTGCAACGVTPAPGRVHLPWATGAPT